MNVAGTRGETEKRGLIPAAFCRLQLACWLLLAPAVSAQELPQVANLPDFSWAGYHQGGRPIPTHKPTIHVTGSKIAEALQSARPGDVVRIPPGRHILTQVLQIRASNIVLQGAGRDKTTLVCPRPLAQLRQPSKQWSWSGGMLEIKPAGGRASTVATVTETSRAGSSTLRVKSSSPIIPGEWLLLEWFNDTGMDTLLDHLYGGVVARRSMGQELQRSTAPRVREWIQVRQVAGNRLTLGQPLRIDVRPEWRPRLIRRPLLREVGVEGLTFEFPLTKYPGHLKELGYNGIAISGLVNGWVRDVRTVNADSGIFVGNCRYVTVQDVVCRGRRMHHPLSISWSADCLITRWRIEAPHRHGTTISWAAHGNVFSHGWGRQLAMDAHRAASFQNLHTRITIVHDERPLSPFRSGGSYPRGPHAAARNVYWNVENRFSTGGDKPTRIGGHGEWPRGIFVGWYGNRPLVFEPARNMRQQVVALNRKPSVTDLHAYQLRARRKTEKTNGR